LSIKVKVLFFGATADAAGEREVEMILDNSIDAARTLSLIIEKFPHLGSRKLLFARNQEYVTGSETIADGDELAVFTAVSGG
jgi:molybdopterin converting factor small subunit